MWRSSNSNRSRPDDKINQVIDKIFHGRLLDKGTCKSCSKTEAMGIFSPEGHDKFYCRDCWKKYLRETHEADWQDWVQWDPPARVCPSENSYQHELKCMLLALSRIGGSITFSPSLSPYDRRKVHEFCEKEPELASLNTKSYGEGSERFLRVSSVDVKHGLAEAKALLQAEHVQAIGSNFVDLGQSSVKSVSKEAAVDSRNVEEHGKKTESNIEHGKTEGKTAKENKEVSAEFKKNGYKTAGANVASMADESPCCADLQISGPTAPMASLTQTYLQADCLSGARPPTEDKTTVKHVKNDQEKQGEKVSDENTEFPSLSSSGLGHGGRKKKGKR